MSGVEIAKLVRLVQRELGKRPIDTTRLSVSVSSGIVYIRGPVRKIRGYEHLDLVKEMEIIHRTLRAKPEFREVHTEDVNFR